MPVSRPSDWDAAVTVARYRMLGYTQAEAGDMAGVVASTVSSWENSPWWTAAMDEARTKEFSETAAKALGVIKNKINEGDATTARWFLNKVHPVLADKSRQGIRSEDRGIPDLSDMSETELRKLAADENDDDEVIDAEFEDADNQTEGK